MKRFNFRAVALAAAGILSASAAVADVQLDERGPVGYLSSFHLRPGDEQAVEEFLDRPRAQPLRILYLDSRGGNPGVGVAIGRLIREHGLDTGFDVRRGRCVSACTTMFLGGVHRYYLGGEGVRDGAGTRVGLGFHPPRNPRPGNEEMLNAFYQEMGTPGAARLRYKLYPRETLDQGFDGPGKRTLFFAGGRTAVRSGVATSTSVPPGLRD